MIREIQQPAPCSAPPSRHPARPAYCWGLQLKLHPQLRHTPSFAWCSHLHRHHPPHCLPYRRRNHPSLRRHRCVHHQLLPSCRHFSPWMLLPHLHVRPARSLQRPRTCRQRCLYQGWSRQRLPWLAHTTVPACPWVLSPVGPAGLVGLRCYWCCCIGHTESACGSTSRRRLRLGDKLHAVSVVRTHSLQVAI
jgi:hypothetical protein